MLSALPVRTTGVLSREPLAAAGEELSAAVAEVCGFEPFFVSVVLPQEQRSRQAHKSNGSNMKEPLDLGFILFLLKHSFFVADKHIFKSCQRLSVTSIIVYEG